MDFSLLKLFLKKLKKENFKDFIILSGGEPLLYPNLIELFEIIKNDFKNIIITNFSQFSVLEKLIKYQPFIIFSIHLEYINFYLKI